MTDEFKGMSLEDIKRAIETKPKHIPDTVLDTAAMHAAIDRFQAERQAKEIREWLVYEAPPGMYDLYVEEKKKLEEQEAARIKSGNRFAGTFILILLGFLFYNLYQLSHVARPQ
jgi:hypothetical protein